MSVPQPNEAAMARLLPNTFENYKREMRVNMAVNSRAAPDRFQQNLLDMTCAQNDLHRQFQKMHAAEAIMEKYRVEKSIELYKKNRRHK